MTNSVVSVIPQEIIDSIIEAVDSERLLRTCTLVSSSFLLPSRKRLFSAIVLASDDNCQRLYQLLVDNPIVQSFIRSITIDVSHFASHRSKVFKSHFQLNCPSMIAVLQLPLHRLESFSIDLSKRSSCKDFSSELMDALSTIIHSATLKTLDLRNLTDVPTMLFQDVHISKLNLSCLSPNDFDTGQSNSLAPVASEGVVITTPHMAIDHCVWNYIDSVDEMEGNIGPIFLPFMCRTRVVEIYVCVRSFGGTLTIDDFNFLSFIMGSLRISLTSPATLEHLKMTIDFEGWDNDLASYYYNSFLGDLCDDDVWSSLDSIITHPTGSRLQRVDINIKYSFRADDNVMEPDETEVEEPILDALPLLREKGILFVEATVNG